MTECMVRRSILSSYRMEKFSGIGCLFQPTTTKDELFEKIYNGYFNE